MMFKAVSPGGKQLRLDQLSMAELHAIARRHELEWHELFYGPLANGAAGIELYVFCCEKLGETLDPATVTVHQAIKGFERVPEQEEDDLPTEFEDQIPQREAG